MFRSRDVAHQMAVRKLTGGLGFKGLGFRV